MCCFRKCSAISDTSWADRDHGSACCGIPPLPSGFGAEAVAYVAHREPLATLAGALVHISKRFLTPCDGSTTQAIWSANRARSKTHPDLNAPVI